MATDFPTEGDDLKISLRNSQYPQFDRAFGEMLREEHRDIWAAGGNIRGNEAFTLWGRARDGEETDGVLDWIKEREAWAARHFDDGAQFSGGDESPNLSNIGGVVAQIKWGVIGNLGEQGMKDVILELVKKREGKQEERKLSDEVEAGLETKRDEHNEEVGDDELRRVTLPMLRTVLSAASAPITPTPARSGRASVLLTSGHMLGSTHFCLR